MMGSNQRAFAPIVAVSPDHLVPADHFYRRLDRVLDLAFVRDLVTDRYPPCGRPSVDPVVFFKLQLVMLFEGIHPERQLLALAEPPPDHSSLTRIRGRSGLDIFRRFFDAVVARCVAAGLVRGAELYFDATKVAANAAAASVRPRFAVEAHLATLFAPDAPGDGMEAGDGDALDTPRTPVALPRTLSANGAGRARGGERPTPRLVRQGGPPAACGNPRGVPPGRRLGGQCHRSRRFPAAHTG